MGFMTQLISESRTLELSDLRVRPYGITDAPRLRRMSDRLSERSLYFRFFIGTPRIPEIYVRHLDRLDHWDHEALVALADYDMVGVAEYIRDPADRTRAELAVLVADPWQHRGVGRLLIGALAHTAVRRGITAFDAGVLPGNDPALAAIRSLWPQARPRYEDGSARFRLPLAA
ncbi:GCN5-related N-acetyltransferase [Thermomonospora curvata DSM 43183]|uniref:GCN5-related N-acetyltransferase n=2 Tax=Thermomonosporaceae TaxID=2012 RepID=D1AEJ4_THECD|nr:GCN5-related N-acetyltransferase [Thermomonospora curvata DSM 43183]PKK16063.1 MAG: N-acetyltransferase [Thermomonospora sp. CIF 1]